MSEFKVNTDLFGCYAQIPTGFSKNIHFYKIVSSYESNCYCDVPLLTCKTEETRHEEMVEVLNVIHCGIDESKVIRVALKDCNVINDNEWINVKDKFPAFDEKCLVYTDEEEDNINISKFYGFGEEFQGYKEYPTGVWQIDKLGVEVLYWMPLPKSPKEMEANNG